MAKITAKQVLDVAREEIGYCEKETNSQLNDKTANAGDGNYTKYWVDLYNAGYYQASKQGYAWCDGWVDWCFLKACGNKTDGEWTECQTGLYGAGCEWSSDCYRRAGRFGTEPKVGAQIFFGKTDAESHTGLVENFDSTYVYTIEGNTSNKVARRTYKRNDGYIVGYGYPRYEEETTQAAPEAPQYDVNDGAMTDEQVFAYLKKSGLTDAGAAGLMGNLYAESAMRSHNLQNTYEKKLAMTDEEYTKAVDNGTYTNFVKDAAGYGLAQWTYWSRKEALLNYMKEQKVSIGNKAKQVEFLIKELKGYKNTYKVLTTTTDVKAASDVVLTEYERPADMSDAVKVKRAGYAQGYYDKYATKAPAEPQKPAEQPKPVDPTPTQPTTQIKVGDLVCIVGTTYYSGTKIPTWVKEQNWYVKSISGNRVVIDKNEKGTNSICSPVHIDNLELVKSQNATQQPTPLKVGDVVKIKKNCNVYGKTYKFQSWVYDAKLYVREIREDSVVISTLKTGDVTGVVAKEDIIR